MTATTSAPTLDQARDFRVVTVFRVGDCAVRCVQTAWRAEYAIATRGVEPGEVEWANESDSLAELLACYSAEILWAVRDAIRDDSTFRGDDQPTESDKANLLVRSEAMDRAAKATGGTLLHWDDIEPGYLAGFSAVISTRNGDR